ncbi:MAG: hypothetical protein POELPBGB_00646 [Bacteroidia bacterium]|nr:hypothetical protein [Bacteroidia bacterium]
MSKKIILFASMLFIYSASFSQTSESAEAEKNLSKATEHLKAKKYQDALVSIAKAKEETVKLFSGQLAVALPKTVEGWNQNPPSEKGTGMPLPMGQGEISVTRSYSNPSLKKPETPNTQPTEKAAAPAAPTSATAPPTAGIPGGMPAAMPVAYGDPAITVTITNNTMWANEVATAHTNATSENPMPAYAMPGMEAQKTAPIKVGEYRALERFDTNRKSGSVTVIAGAGVIKVEGNNIENKDILAKVANAVDYKVVKSVLGE